MAKVDPPPTLEEIESILQYGLGDLSSIYVDNTKPYFYSDLRLVPEDSYARLQNDYLKARRPMVGTTPNTILPELDAAFVCAPLVLSFGDADYIQGDLAW